MKWPRFAFEKFPGVDAGLSTHMKSVGEVMAIGRTFGQAFGKALRSRELDALPSLEGSDEELLTRLETPGADRFDVLLELQQRGVTDGEIRVRTGIDPWFLRELRDLDRAFDGVRTLQGRRHLRGRVRGRDAVLLLRLGADRPRPRSGGETGRA